jgi:glucosamine 6-phosphate synthetase-like amidotransferase/phosphosugar isomerase protein
LEQAKAAGAYTISITSNQPGERIQVAADVLNTVDAEVSAAFTISYTSALMVLGMLASALTEEGSALQPMRAWRRSPRSLAVFCQEEIRSEKLPIVSKTGNGLFAWPPGPTLPTPTK